ncbi:MAG: hypothetical protein DRI90_28550 [Deltaproteobacteria bacterium]|nr:MAG: hypothetical protein DRI90_28550 [Deltaproteobacteria bacterium]
MPALQFRQWLIGAYDLGVTPHAHLGKPLALRADLRATSLRGLLAGTLELHGEVTAAGFADHQPIEGTVSLSTKRRLRVRFDFNDNRGSPHSFTGDKRLSWLRLPQPLTVLEGKIATATGNPVGRALLRFDLRHELWPLLGSIRCRLC